MFFFKRTPSITTSALEKKLPENPKIIDVREPSEFTSGHIPGAINVPLGKISNYKPTTTVYVICQSGARSQRASKILNDQGFDVINVKGGMMSWKGKTRQGKL